MLAVTPYPTGDDSTFSPDFTRNPALLGFEGRSRPEFPRSNETYHGRPCVTHGLMESVCCMGAEQHLMQQRHIESY